MRQPFQYTMFEYIIYTIIILLLALPIEFYEYRTFGKSEPIGIGLIAAWFFISLVSYQVFYRTKKNVVWTTSTFAFFGFFYEFFFNSAATAPWLAWIVTWILIASLVPSISLSVFNQYFEPDY